MARLSQQIRHLKQAGQIERMGVILSTHLTNEDLYVAKRVFKSLGVKHLAVQPARQGSSDGFLMRADKSPNTRGAQALGLSFDAEAVLDRAARQEISMLYVCGPDLAQPYGAERARQALSSVELLVFQGSNVNATSQQAHLVLPSAVYAEKDGTFTNEQGRVQRIRRALAPLGEAKPDWQIFMELASAMNLFWEFSDAQAVFRSIASHEPAFKGLSEEVIGDHGAPLNA